MGSFDYGSGLVGMNRNSTVRNSSVNAKSFSLCCGAGLVSYNYSEGGYADAVVENCYFYGRINDGSLNSICTGGLVCYNETAPNDNGKKAIVRNCHCTPTERFTERDYGIFVYRHSVGSLISNCYMDITSFSSTDNMVGVNEGGQMTDCSRYTNIDGVGTLALPVTVNGTTTTNLIDALNLWIEEQEHPELYKTWAMVTDSIPMFGDYFVGVSENEAENKEVVFYPNPTTGQVTIMGKDLKEAEVVNLFGQRVLTVIGGGDEIHFNIAKLASGVYFINISDGEKRSYVTKVVKE